MKTHPIKVTYQRKRLTGDLFIVFEDESMAIMVGNIVSGRHDAEAVAGSLHLIHKPKA